MTKYYSIREAADILGIPHSTMYRWAREGKLQHLGAIRISSKTVIPKSVLDKEVVA